MGLILLTACRPEMIGSTALPPAIIPTRTQLLQPTNTNCPLPLSPTFFLPPTQTDIPPLEISAPSPSTIERYGWLELDLQTTAQVNNPYDPDEINIQVQFTSPSGKLAQAGAFWYQDFDLQTRQPKGDPGWRVHFSPTEPGTWGAKAHIVGAGLESRVISFQVVESDNPGFVRINPANPRYLAFDSGDIFFPIGLNIGWWGGGAPVGRRPNPEIGGCGGRQLYRQVVRAADSSLAGGAGCAHPTSYGDYSHSAIQG